MGSAEVELIKLIVDMIGKYGIPAAMKLIQSWQMADEPTAEDIRALAAKMPEPESFFNDADG